MRESYDCHIVGDDPAACLIATHVAEQGFRTLLTYEERATTSGVEHWLLPASNETFSALRQLDLAGDPLSMSREVMLERVDVDQSLLPMHLMDAGDFRNLCLAKAQANDVDVVPATVSAPASIVVSGQCAEPPAGPVIWGHYRHVCREPGPAGGTAMEFASSTGSKLWLIPIDEERTSVGVCLADTDRCRVDLRATWEDELVACPALVARLFDAQLVDALRAWRPPVSESPSAAITYRPCDDPAPLRFSWKSLLAAVDVGRTIVASLRQTPVY